MKKLIKEFKAFITRGNVVDLAVGMIIGAAFTAIVNALVNNIFKPLINWIPIGNQITGLRTPLGNTVYLDEAHTVVDWANTNYIDWGAFLMAIVNFLLTAVVLFILIKIINAARSGFGGLKKDADFINSITEEEWKAVGGKKTGKNIKKIAAMREEEKQKKEAEEKAKAEAEAAAKAAADAAKAEETNNLLREIRDLLQNK